MCGLRNIEMEPAAAESRDKPAEYRAAIV